MLTSEECIADWQERIRSAIAQRTPVHICGARSKPWMLSDPAAPQEHQLNTCAYRGIVSYQPSELVITARCGTPLAEIQAVLYEHRQMLAFEPPDFDGQATWGGSLAAGLCGPRRASAGAVRDFVLGVRMLNGRGEHLRFGGQVMKNVAGYDISRALVGSQGVLGVITEASLKVLPQPRCDMTLSLTLPQDQALYYMNLWATQAWPISASAWHQGQLTLRLSGAEAAVRAMQQQCQATTVDDATARDFWQSLREQTHVLFRTATPLWRVCLPAAAPTLKGPSPFLIEWGGMLRWFALDAWPPSLQQQINMLGGWVQRHRDASARITDGLPPALCALHQRLKAEFDPAMIFNPGKWYAHPAG